MPKAFLKEPRHHLLEGPVGCTGIHRSDCQQEVLWSLEAQAWLVLGFSICTTQPAEVRYTTEQPVSYRSCSVQAGAQY